MMYWPFYGSQFPRYYWLAQELNKAVKERVVWYIL